MNKSGINRLSILFAVICIIISVVSSPRNTFSMQEKRPVNSMTAKEKKIIVDYVYSVIDSYLSQKELGPMPRAKTRSMDFNYDKVYLSLYHKNNLLGCQSGSVDADKPGRLFEDLKDAAVKTIKDSRFGDNFRLKFDQDTYIILYFLYNKQKMAQNSLDYLTKEIELGIHSISFDSGEKETFFLCFVPIADNYTLKKTLQNLCHKAGLKDDCSLDNTLKIYGYDTLTFKGGRKTNIVDLYRFNILISPDEITQGKILESILLFKDWITNNINPRTKLLEYEYYPSRDSYSGKGNDTRQTAAIWGMAVLRRFLKTNLLDDYIKEALNYYLAYKKTRDDYAYIDKDGSSLLSYSAFMLMALLEADYPNKNILSEELAKGILAQQQEDGSYKINFNSAKERADSINYYPGEAMLALMKAYSVTKNTVYLDSLKRAFVFYRNYWRKNKNTAFITWHTQAYYLLYKETKEQELVDFVFEMNDWLIDEYQVFESKYIDEIGGFHKDNPRGCSTATYLEGINDAYRLALERKDLFHKDKYADSIKSGVRFILQSQFTGQNSFYLKNPKRAIGCIRTTLTNNSLRVDYMQHSVMALIKAYNNQIFSKNE